VVGAHGTRRWAAFERVLEDATLDAALVTHLPSVRYLTGFSGSSGVVLHSRLGSPALITDFRYEEQAAAEVAEPIRVHIAREGWLAGLGEIVEEGGIERAGFEPEYLTVLDRDRLSARVPEIEWVPAPGLMTGLRTVKDRDEIERIRMAATVAEGALERLIAAIDWSAGPTEMAVAAHLEFELRSGGSGPLPFEPIVAGGPRTSLPHATPSGRAIGPGDLLLLDFGATVEGYCSDLTRTFVIGSAADWQTDAHAQVLAAQSEAIEAIRPGASAATVDRTARQVLASAEMDVFFGHGLGHGLGLEVHEAPRLSARSDDVLEPGNVVTVEPGVYLPGRGGVRIEDDVAVTRTGCRVLTSAPRDLIAL